MYSHSIPIIPIPPATAGFSFPFQIIYVQFHTIPWRKTQGCQILCTAVPADAVKLVDVTIAPTMTMRVRPQFIKYTKKTRKLVTAIVVDRRSKQKHAAFAQAGVLIALSAGI